VRAPGGHARVRVCAGCVALTRAAACVSYGSFCAFMVHISPIFLAPYFRHFCPECARALHGAIIAAAHRRGGHLLRRAPLRLTRRRAARPALRFDKNKGTSPRGVCVPGYLSSTVFCAVLSTLFAVAVDMSDPWDGIGADDLHFVIDIELEEATRAESHALNPHTGAQGQTGEGLRLRCGAAALRR
jgi:hypothetical protein